MDELYILCSKIEQKRNNLQRSIEAPHSIIREPNNSSLSFAQTPSDVTDEQTNLTNNIIELGHLIHSQYKRNEVLSTCRVTPTHNVHFGC